MRCGYITIAGRSNVGKSTLLNHLLGQKLSITSRKPQTTRHHLLGIKTIDNAQLLFLDTPGIQIDPKDPVNRFMNREAVSVIPHSNLILFMIEASGWTDSDKIIWDKISNLSECESVLVINKVDRLKDKQKLLSLIQSFSQYSFAEILPISAKQEKDVTRLEQTIIKYLPESEAVFPEDQLTDKSSRFIAAEFIREKLMQSLGDELPYKLAVTIDEFKEAEKCTNISATIWVEQQRHKRIIIGTGGAILKKVGEQARKDMQKLFGKKIYLRTWVKIRHNWTSDERAKNLLQQI